MRHLATLAVLLVALGSALLLAADFPRGCPSAVLLVGGDR